MCGLCWAFLLGFDINVLCACVPWLTFQCSIQGSLIQFGHLASAMWQVSLALELHIVRHAQPHAPERSQLTELCHTDPGAVADVTSCGCRRQAGKVVSPHVLGRSILGMGHTVCHGVHRPSGYGTSLSLCMPLKIWTHVNQTAAGAWCWITVKADEEFLSWTLRFAAFYGIVFLDIVIVAVLQVMTAVAVVNLLRPAEGARSGAGSVSTPKAHRGKAKQAAARMILFAVVFFCVCVATCVRQCGRSSHSLDAAGGRLHSLPGL